MVQGILSFSLSRIVCDLIRKFNKVNFKLQNIGYKNYDTVINKIFLSLKVYCTKARFQVVTIDEMECKEHK